MGFEGTNDRPQAGILPASEYTKRKELIDKGRAIPKLWENKKNNKEKKKKLSCCSEC